MLKVSSILKDRPTAIQSLSLLAGTLSMIHWSKYCFLNQSFFQTVNATAGTPSRINLMQQPINGGNLPVFFLEIQLLFTQHHVILTVPPHCLQCRALY